jgi:hypothetical protein
MRVVVLALLVSGTASAECEKEDRAYFEFTRRTGRPADEPTRKAREDCYSRLRREEQAQEQAELKAKREAEEREAAEKKRKEEEARAANNAKVDAENKALDDLLENDKARALIFGSIFCALQADRKERLDEIAEEKKYARLAGMVDKVKLYRLQTQIRNIDKRLAEERDTLKSWKGTKPMACTSGAVQHVLSCRTEERPAQCNSPELALIMHYVPRENTWDYADD